MLLIITILIFDKKKVFSPAIVYLHSWSPSSVFEPRQIPFYFALFCSFFFPQLEFIVKSDLGFSLKTLPPTLAT